MTIVEHKWSVLPVPRAVDVVDRVRKEHFNDPGFHAMEAGYFRPRIWQMGRRATRATSPTFNA